MAITLERIKNKKVVVGVVGLGYVGYPLSLVFAEAGVKVIGFDIDATKVSSINAARGYYTHIANERLVKAVKAKRFYATSDFRRVADCDAIIICVPTPLDEHLEPDLSFVTQTAESIGPHLQPHTLVSLESTSWPGTLREVVRPIVENLSGLHAGKDLFLSFSPEREDPGNRSYNTRNIPKLVGADDAKSQKLAVALYALAIEKVVPASSSAVAESAKLLENIFRGVNIALVNELKMIFDRMGINIWEVIKAASTKPFGYMPFWPGPGLGGHCIPIDPFYLTWKAKAFGINTRFIELAGEINRYMPRWVVDKVQDCLNVYAKPLKGSKVLILGLAYKADIEDMRESPSLELIKLLEEKGAKVDYYDPFIEEIGPNREYPQLMGRKSKNMTKNYDCFVVATRHKCLEAKKILSFGVPVVDTRNLLPKHKNVFQA